MYKKDVGFVGGGQLGRMGTEAAHSLGLSVAVLEKPGYCPAEQVGAYHIVAPSLYDHEGLRKLAAMTKVVTLEIEHTDALELIRIGEEYDVQPTPATLAVIQDKHWQHEYLDGSGIPVAPFFSLDTRADFDYLTSNIPGLIIKRRFGAYDGRGNLVWDGQSWDETKDALRAKGENEPLLYAEKTVPFKMELSGLVVRDRDGYLLPYPIVETIHKNNICNIVISPARIDDAIAVQATELALNTASTFQGAGVFAVEMFLTNDRQVLVNEVAPRVHNSGHHTIEGNYTSQFEQHLRAITGRELGDPSIFSPAVMINVLGERDGDTKLEGLDRLAKLGRNVFLHMYGKSPTKVDRKMGHITVIDDDVNRALEVAQKARSLVIV